VVHNNAEWQVFTFGPVCTADDSHSMHTYHNCTTLAMPRQVGYASPTCRLTRVRHLRLHLVRELHEELNIQVGSRRSRFQHTSHNNRLLCRAVCCTKATEPKSKVAQMVYAVVAFSSLLHCKASHSPFATQVDLPPCVVCRSTQKSLTADLCISHL